MAERVALRIRAEGVCVEIKETTGKLSGQEIASAACGNHVERPACVVACGGDGTIQEVVNALVPWRSKLGGQCPALGIAPAGRCNDFATVLGLPREPDAIADVLLHGRPAPIDLGKVNDRYFCTVATLGVDAQVSGFVDRMRMPLRGTPAYVYGALRVLSRYRPCQVHIEGDFGVIDRPVFLASSANTSTYGGAIPIVPHADPVDGFLDLCVIDNVSRLRAFSMLPIVMAGRHVRRPGVTFLQTRSARFTTQQSVELWADGERIATTPATIESAPLAVEVLVPSFSPLLPKAPAKAAD
jgi:diacylglycerol kinase (ATP)